MGCTEPGELSRFIRPARVYPPVFVLLLRTWCAGFPRSTAMLEPVHVFEWWQLRTCNNDRARRIAQLDTADGGAARGFYFDSSCRCLRPLTAE